MSINIVHVIFGAIAAAVVWFIIGSVLYMNPFVAKIYKKAEGMPGLKIWPNLSQYIVLQFVGILIQCVLWAFVFVLIKPVLIQETLMQGFVFGLILIAFKISRRFFDMWIQSTYPNRLLVIEFINGAIGSFVIGILFAYII
jgi:sterol desaturase/sphingolipid hydroxylase (fatty acid hydroxylase superfamily)